MSYQKYPSYKESGIDWLGQVPSHWGVAPLKRGFDVTLGKMLQPDAKGAEDELVPYLRAANIQWGGIETSDVKQMWLSARDRHQLDLQYGDLLVSEGGDVGRSCLWENEIENCSFQNSVNRVRARKANSTNFLRYWMSTIKDKGYVDVLCNKSTIAHFTAEKVAAVPVPFPPPHEQSLISTFLDCETQKIDELAKAFDGLIGLLKEKRQAVISHAVTKGLDFSVPMKDSRIEWLGQVPAHWKICKLNSIARLESGHTPSRQRPDYWVEDECVIPWFTLADVGFLRNDRNTVIKKTSQKISQVGIENSSARLLPPDTVLLSRTASVGFSGVTSISLAVSQDFAAWICSIHINPRYLLFILRAMKPEFQRLMMGSTHQTIYMPDIEAFRVSVPPISEQLAIVDFIESETSKLDNLTSEAQRAIELLQERRTALISAAVTGKIDVRGLANVVEEEKILETA